VELLDGKYYPRDVQRTKEREFLSLKQGRMTVMEYVARFNELSRFAMHQVNTEERKMDHFEQGLRGDIKSVIAGQTFASSRTFTNEQLRLLECWRRTRRRLKSLT